MDAVGIFYGHLVYFPPPHYFVSLTVLVCYVCQETSGNPAHECT
jgi:hypothetical protein